MITAQDYAGFGLAHCRVMISNAQSQEKVLDGKLKQICKSARDLSGEIEANKKRLRDVGKLASHEQSHYGREIEDLLARDEVVDVKLLQNGIKVTTKPINSFRGKQEFEIDLLIAPHDAPPYVKPKFKVIGENNGFQLKCLNGSGGGHDSEIDKMLKSARLAEAGMLALDLIQFGSEGGP